MGSIVLAVCVLFFSVSAQAVTIDFEGLAAMTRISGNPIPLNVRLSDQFLPTLGVRFASGSDYVPVIILDDIPNHSPNGSNGIGGSTDTGLITYNDAFPITISFWDPSNPSLPATTDFVSITGDLRGSSFTVSFDAFDLAGNLVASDSGQDIGGRTYSVAADAIHTVRWSGVPTPTFGGSGGVGLDLLTFNAVTPIPEPSTLLLLGVGLAGLGYSGRWRMSNRKSKPESVSGAASAHDKSTVITSNLSIIPLLCVTMFITTFAVSRPHVASATTISIIGTPAYSREADEGTVPRSGNRFNRAQVGTGGDDPQAGQAGLL